MSSTDAISSTFNEHPSMPKLMGKQIVGFDDYVWESVGMYVVVAGNFCKFTQNDRLMHKLMSTGQRPLVEKDDCY